MKEEIKSLISTFYLKQEKFKSIEKSFTKMKKEFYEKMNEYFATTVCGAEKIAIPFSENPESERVLVSKVERKKIIFDADKIEKVLKNKGLNKTEINSAIEKKVFIKDYTGLIKYLKICGVSPERFKSFLDVEKKVIPEALDNLEALGKIEIDDIKGCYSVETGNPYYRVSLGKVSGDTD